MSDLPAHIEPVARLLMGDPNMSLSKPGRELRYGRGGSLKIDLRAGTFFDHEAGSGGGVLDLVIAKAGVPSRALAAEWLKERGFQLSDDRPATSAASAKPVQVGGGVKSAAKREIETTYDYLSKSGELLYQVVRYNPKGFGQRRPDGNGGWIWKLGDVAHTLYRLPELEEALSQEAVVFLVEGEKDADTLWRAGIPASTNSGGAQHWNEGHAETFRGADVVIAIDNDKAGRERAEKIATSLHEIARRIRVLDFSATLPGHVMPIWPDMPPKQDISDWFSRETRDNPTSDAAGQLYEIVSELPIWGPDVSFKSTLGLILWQDLGKPREPLEYLVKDWLTAGEVSILAGPSGSGKSFVSIDIAMCVARGVEFLGRHRVKSGGVVYQAGEGAKGLRDKRLPAYRVKHGLKWEDAIPLAVLPKPIDLFHDDNDVSALIEDIGRAEAYLGTKIRLVVIDTASAATPGADENSSKDVSPVLARCNRIAAATGAHVMLVAHMNADGSKVRGHTSWHANVDTVITCRLVEGLTDASRRKVREATIIKQKDGDPGLPVRFVLPSVEIGRDHDGDPITSCTVSEPDEGEIQGVDRSKPAERRGVSPQAVEFLQALRKAISSHGVEATSVGVPLPYGLHVVDYQHFKAVFAESSFEGADEADPEKRAARIRKAIERAGKSLAAKGIIGRKNPWMWVTGKQLEGSGSVTPKLEVVTDNGANGPGDWSDLSQDD